MELMLAGILALGVFLMFVGSAFGKSSPSRVATVVGQYVRPRTLEEVEFDLPFTARVVRPALRVAAQAFSRYTPEQVIEGTRRKLDLAGNPFDLPVIEFIGVRVALMLLLALLSALGATLSEANAATVLLAAVGGGALGNYLPVLWLDIRRRERQSEIQTGLPDALDLLTVCVEAGLGLHAAMTQVAEKWNNQLSRAFGRALQEIRLGKPRQAALHDMADRAAVQELTSFVAAVIQAEQFGAEIARVLRVQSDMMRVIRRQRAQTKANQAAIKLLFPLVFFIFPAMFIVLLGPAVLRLMKGF